MNDLERLFRLIVNSLSTTDPARLRRAIPLADIRDSIAPYRATRRALQWESSEDYELALMRLCAGEGGFARLDNEDLGRAFAHEIKSRNPDLTLLRQHERVGLILNPWSLPNHDPHEAYAPPAPPESKARSQRKPVKAVQDARPTAPSRCPRCRADLPVGRVVNFCPQCGYDQRHPHCSQCSAELEAHWRHCVICGIAVNPG